MVPARSRSDDANLFQVLALCARLPKLTPHRTAERRLELLALRRVDDFLRCNSEYRGNLAVLLASSSHEHNFGNAPAGGPADSRVHLQCWRCSGVTVTARANRMRWSPPLSTTTLGPPSVKQGFVRTVGDSETDRRAKQSRTDAVLILVGRRGLPR
jgi:hypothetical protein